MWICLMYTYVYSIHIHEPHEFAWKWYPKNWINKSWFRIMVVHHHHHIIIWFDLIWIELISFDFIWFHLISFDFIWFHLISFGFIWFQLISFDFIWFHLVSFDFNWFHLISHFIPFHSIWCDLLWWYASCLLLHHCPLKHCNGACDAPPTSPRGVALRSMEAQVMKKHADFYHRKVGSKQQNGG